MSTSTSTSTSIGLSIGRAIGNSVAYTAHGALRASQMTGQFGKDIATGAAEQYGIKSAELAARRAELLADTAFVKPVANRKVSVSKSKVAA